MDSKGDLMPISDAAVRAGISKSTIDVLVKKGHVTRYKIHGYSFVHYRDVLRGAWEFEQTKTRHGIINDAKRTK